MQMYVNDVTSGTDVTVKSVDDTAVTLRDTGTAVFGETTTNGNDAYAF